MASKSFCKGSKFSYIGLDEIELPVSERSEYPRFFVLQNDASRNPTGFSPWEECEQPNNFTKNT